ncbi:MAG TPA: TauD/TfdA family dioxygenase [Pirellulaceae bacterium]
MQVSIHSVRPDQPLPQVIEPVPPAGDSVADLCNWIGDHREDLFARLTTHGGVLFRHFQVQGPDDFGRVAAAVTAELRPYIEGQSPRTKIAKDVYTSTEYPSRFRITLHNELSYALHPPTLILFGCEVPPESGGETPLVDCRKVYQGMDPDVRQRFVDRGVLYVKHMHGDASGMGKSWMDHFETTDRARVEDYLRENKVSYEWIDGNGLRTEAIRPAVRQHPRTGEWLWFNQANLWHVGNLDASHRAQLVRTFGEDRLPTHAYFGDRTPISEEELDHVQRTLWDSAVIFPWERGDVLVLDNFLVAHGRMPFAGPRRILVAMGAAAPPR